MKKHIASILVIVLMLTCVLTSCGADKDDIVGTWMSDVFWSDDGYTAVFTVEFKDNGTFTQIKYKYSGYIPMTTESGTYEIDGNEILCTKGRTTTHYEYKDGTLTSGIRVYNKI